MTFVTYEYRCTQNNTLTLMPVAIRTMKVYIITFKTTYISIQNNALLRVSDYDIPV